MFTRQPTQGDAQSRMCLGSCQSPATDVSAHVWRIMGEKPLLSTRAVAVGRVQQDGAFLPQGNPCGSVRHPGPVAKVDDDVFQPLGERGEIRRKFLAPTMDASGPPQHDGSSGAADLDALHSGEPGSTLEVVPLWVVGQFTMEPFPLHVEKPQPSFQVELRGRPIGECRQ